MIEFKDRLKELRKERGLSQKELAKNLGYKSRSTIAKIEKGIIFPTSQNLIGISKLFDVSTDYLLGISDRKYNFENASLENLSDEYFKKVRETPIFD